MKLTKLHLFLAGFVASFGAVLLIFSQTTSAATFAPNRIIDNQVFDNQYTMSAAAIDNFLNGFPSSCISTNRGFQALVPSGYSPSTGYSYGGYASAGTVIAAAAAAYNINPQVLLTTLQKEQSLVSGTAGCSTLRYAAATGYGCPDSGTTHDYTGVNLYAINGVPVTSVAGTCVNTASKVGFSQQVIRAAWLLKFGEQRSEGNMGWAIISGSWNNSDDLQACYGGPMTQGTFQVCPSGNKVYYDGYITVDGTAVHIDDGATAALYWYTPHFSGNRNFFNIFVGWFGLPYAYDTLSAHPNGTLISDGGNIYLLDNNTRRHITNPWVFQSYGYRWSEVKTASTGDNNLPLGGPLDTLAAGTLFTTDNSPVYVMDVFSGTLMKQHMSYYSFNVLGYTWKDVMYVPSWVVPAATADGIYTKDRHPAGTVVLPYGVGKIFLMNANDKSHVQNPLAFDSNHFSYARLKGATLSDIQTPEGSPVDIRIGTLILNGGIYVVDYDSGGIMARPVGPWECYTNRLHYSWTDWLLPTYGGFPLRIGPTFTC